MSHRRCRIVFAVAVIIGSHVTVGAFSEQATLNINSYNRHQPCNAMLSYGVCGTKCPPIIDIVSPCIRLPIKSSVLANRTKLFLVAIGLRLPLKGRAEAF